MSTQNHDSRNTGLDDGNILTTTKPIDFDLSEGSNAIPLECVVLDRETDTELDAYADRHGMTMSEAAAHLIKKALTGDPLKDRANITGRVFEIESLLDVMIRPLINIKTENMEPEDALNLGHIQMLVPLAQRLAAELAKIADGEPAHA